MTVLVTGASGMVGRNLVELFEKNEIPTLKPSSNELNLLSENEVKKYFMTHQIDVIVHCAGLVGGIQANIAKPFSFFYNNLLMGANVVMSAAESKIQKLINLGSSCMYPRDLDTELKENDILKGELEPTNEGYALAKISIAKMCEYLSQEKNIHYKTLIPCNLYGRWDKFDPQRSHMIPSVIHKLYLAKLNGSTPKIWGDGSARREFMYVEDLTNFILFSISNYEKIDSYMNVGLGYDYSIKEYYEKIASVVGYQGGFEYDLSKPSGMQKKLCSVEKLKMIGWQPNYSLEQGIEKTYNFYLKHHGV